MIKELTITRMGRVSSLCSARDETEQFEADLFGIVRVWLRETSECTARLFSGEAVARSAYFARRFFSTIKRLDDITKINDAYKMKSSRG